MINKGVVYGLLLLLMVSVLGGCFAGPGSRWHKPQDPPPNVAPAGFWAGLWHGFIAIPALILGIFTDIKIYEWNNTGWWYEFAFLLGLGTFGGGGIKLGSDKYKKK